MTRLLAGLALAAVYAQEPAPPSAEEQSRILEQARTVALNYTRTLPDFICSQIVRRYAPRGAGWKLADTLLIRLAYTSGHEDYTLIAINGHASRRDYSSLEGSTTTGEFGSLLKRIFHWDSHTGFEWDHWADLRGRRTQVFAFHIPLTHSHHSLTIRSPLGIMQRVLVADRGFVHVDSETGQVLRVASHSEDIPTGFQITAEATTLDYDYTDIAGSQYLLPLHAEVLLSTRRQTYRNLVQFSGYRRFTTDSTLTFATPTPVPEEKLRETRPSK